MHYGKEARIDNGSHFLKAYCMKKIQQICLALIILGIVFFLWGVFNNLAISVFGLIIFGAGINLLMFDSKAKSRSMIYMWIAIILLSLVLLGLQYLIKDIKIGLMSSI